MASRVLDLLAQQASEAFIGRTNELAILLYALEDRSLVAFAPGIAGVGGSTLLEAFVEQARSRGATVLRLDCRAIGPSEGGFIQELGAAIGVAFTAPAVRSLRKKPGDGSIKVETVCGIGYCFRKS